MSYHPLQSKKFNIEGIVEMVGTNGWIPKWYSVLSHFLNLEKLESEIEL